MTEQEINNRFTYHRPIGNQPQRYEALRNKAKELAVLINQLCPESREKSLAITRLEEAIMQANASIARNEGEHNCNVVLVDIQALEKELLEWKTLSVDERFRRLAAGAVEPCCERDHDKDGNCDKHPASTSQGPFVWMEAWLRNYDKANGTDVAGKVMDWVNQQPMQQA